MTPPPELVDRLLKQYSVASTARTLAQAGYTVSLNNLHNRVSQLISSGERKVMDQKTREPGGHGAYEIPKGASLEGSEKLLEACLSLYRRRASEVGMSVQDAMLFMLNAPERLGV